VVEFFNLSTKILPIAVEDSFEIIVEELRVYPQVPQKCWWISATYRASHPGQPSLNGIFK
jgi:hypothetical protein